MKMMRAFVFPATVTLALGFFGGYVWSQAEKPESDSARTPTYSELSTDKAATAIQAFLKGDSILYPLLNKKGSTALTSENDARSFFISLLSKEQKPEDLAAQLETDSKTAADIKERAADVYLAIVAESRSPQNPSSVAADARQAAGRLDQQIPAVGESKQAGTFDGSGAQQPQSGSPAQEPKTGEANPPAVPLPDNPPSSVPPTPAPAPAAAASSSRNSPQHPYLAATFFSWSRGSGDIINSQGVLLSVEARVPKVIPPKFGWVGAQVNAFLGSKNGAFTGAYRSDNFLHDDQNLGVVPGSQTFDYYKDWHLISTVQGSALYPIAQLNYHAPRIQKPFWDRFEPYVGVIFARGTQNDSLTVTKELQEHLYTPDTCYNQNGGYYYDCSYWRTNVLERTLVDSVPGTKWAGFVPGVDFGVNTILYKSSGRAALALQTGYQKFYGDPQHIGSFGAWKIGSTFRW